MKKMYLVIMAATMLATVGMSVEPAKMMSRKEVKMLIETASTPAAHNKLAVHYRLQAEQFDAEAQEHSEMAIMYKARPTALGLKMPLNTNTSAHCEFIAENLRNSAARSRTLSAEHAEMAKK